ncbi:hypothetical protein JTB14_030995 [Gonioctena quinquepunctata]|nr:hypothetical protein JTB14_030995 [Gonioctena quinquepunctata]
MKRTTLTPENVVRHISRLHQNLDNKQESSEESSEEEQMETDQQQVDVMVHTNVGGEAQAPITDPKGSVESRNLVRKIVVSNSMEQSKRTEKNERVTKK